MGGDIAWGDTESKPKLCQLVAVSTGHGLVWLLCIVVQAVKYNRFRAAEDTVTALL